MSLSTGGSITGTPSTQGTYNFTITATDADGYTGSRAYSIQVDSQNIVPSISQFQIALIGPNNWGSSVSGSYGTTPQFRWSTTNANTVTMSATSGNSNSNLGTSSTGAPVLGAINAYGTTTITLTATSSTGDVATAVVYFVGPSGPTITISPSSLPNEYINRSYNQTLTASGGTAPYGYYHTSGTFPTGLGLSTSSGAITGTTGAVGTFTFTVTATDNNGYTGSQSYTVSILSAPTVTLSPSSLPGGTTGTSYTQYLSASGGQGPHTFSVTSGSLPSGLSLSPGGTLSGTPSTAGTYNFTVTAYSGDGFNGSQFYSIAISNAVVYNEVFSNSTSTPTANVPFSITVTGGAPNTVARYRLGLGGTEQQVTLNSSGSYTWSNLSVPAGTYTWYFTFDGSGNDRSHTVTVAAAPQSNIVNPLGFNGSTYTAENDDSANIALYLLADGTWIIQDDFQILATANWYTPTTSSIGSGYWVRFTRTSNTGGSYGASEPTTGWQQLSTTRNVYVNANTLGGSVDRLYVSNYTVEISSDSSGSTILSTSTISLRAIALTTGGIPR